MKSVAASTLAMATPSMGTTETTVTGPVFISTLPFGKAANERAAEVFQSGGSLLDAVEKGINTVEDDPKVKYVGYGGLPNEEGVVELDAAIMDGTRHRAGSVCNLHHIKNPISVARQMIEKTRHTTIAGEGAFRFALEMGFRAEQLLTPASLEQWLNWEKTPHHGLVPIFETNG
jgi:N4-(beta-N-acetylglucosaminyl)-L-asparaginase